MAHVLRSGAGPTKPKPTPTLTLTPTPPLIECVAIKSESHEAQTDLGDAVRLADLLHELLRQRALHFVFVSFGRLQFPGDLPMPITVRNRVRVRVRFRAGTDDRSSHLGMEPIKASFEAFLHLAHFLPYLGLVGLKLSVTAAVLLRRQGLSEHRGRGARAWGFLVQFIDFCDPLLHLVVIVLLQHGHDVDVIRLKRLPRLSDPCLERMNSSWNELDAGCLEFHHIGQGLDPLFHLREVWTVRHYAF